MTTFFTSDWHLGHKRIIELADRPFSNVEEMNEHYIAAWQAVVGPEDRVYVLGDWAMGKLDDSLALTGRLPGTKILVSGNHDRSFPAFRQSTLAAAGARQRYLDAGFHTVLAGDKPESILMAPVGVVKLSHFPYSGDSHDQDRYAEYRPSDKGFPLLHGHTHSKERFSRSANGTPQVHVGIDAWPGPVSADEVLALLTA